MHIQSPRYKKTVVFNKITGIIYHKKKQLTFSGQLEGRMLGEHIILQNPVPQKPEMCMLLCLVRWYHRAGMSRKVQLFKTRRCPPTAHLLVPSSLALTQLTFLHCLPPGLSVRRTARINYGSLGTEHVIMAVRKCWWLRKSMWCPPRQTTTDEQGHTMGFTLVIVHLCTVSRFSLGREVSSVPVVASLSWLSLKIHYQIFSRIIVTY